MSTTRNLHSQLELALLNSPIRLCHELVKQLASIRVNYEIKFPVCASAIVRRSLYEIERECEQFSDIYVADRTDFCRKKYLELCGMLRVFSNELKTLNRQLSDEEQILLNILGGILDQIQINADEDLPLKSLRVGKSCVDYYRYLHPIATPTEYSDAVYELRRLSKKNEASDELHQQCKILIKEVETMKENNEPLSYCVTILRETSKLIEPPVNHSRDYEGYMALANAAPGAPSTRKKVLGAMIMIAGIVAFLGFVGLSIFSLVATAGMVTPAILLASNIFVSNLAPVGAAVIGLIGMGIYASGARTGVSSVMKETHNLIKKPVIYPSESDRLRLIRQVHPSGSRLPTNTAPRIEVEQKVSVNRK